jgi:hypothetical protein
VGTESGGAIVYFRGEIDFAESLKGDFLVF